jgi:type I restriction enzyme S subunit
MTEVNIDNITEIIENKIDRTKWKIYKFSDLVDNIVEKVVPKNSDLKHYIGLEHLDSGSLKIKRYGESKSLIGDKLKIYKGDLIFAKRNSYLKRVAISEIDAIASAHAMVLRINNKNVSSDFLPFFMMSDVFWKRAIEISVGSLSPTINWKSLAKQEFLLPTLAEQEILAELIWSLDNVIECEYNLLHKIEILREVKEYDYLLGHYLNSKTKKTKIGDIPIDWSILELDKVSWFQEGPGLRDWQFKNEGIKVINITNIVSGKLDLSKTERHVSWEEFNKSYKHFECDEGDIVIASSGNTYCKHAIIQKSDLPLMMNTSVIRFKPLNGLNYNFLNQFLKSKLLKQQIDILITGAAQPNFGPYHLNQIVVPVPNRLDIQKLIGDKLTLIDDKINEITSKINVSRSLQKSIINQIF